MKRTIHQLLELADWAPTHARTEPWRFVVYTETGLQKFVRSMQTSTKHIQIPKNSPQQNTKSIIQNGEKVSHLILVYMKRQPTKKIPLVEEIAATAAAMEHILLGAQPWVSAACGAQAV